MIPGGTLRAAFVHECAPEKSPWIREHDKGRQQLEQALGDAVSVRTYLAADYPCTEDALEQAVSDGAQVIFTTTVPLIFACRKLAPKYPGRPLSQLLGRYAVSRRADVLRPYLRGEISARRDRRRTGGG